MEQRQTSSNSLCEAKNNYIANNKLPEVYFVACKVEKFVDINEVGGKEDNKILSMIFFQHSDLRPNTHLASVHKLPTSIYLSSISQHLT